MPDSAKFSTLAALTIAGRFYDVGTTYLYSPDLSNETNIIVKLFGRGWFGIISFQSLLTGMVVYFLYFYFYKYEAIHPPKPGLTLKQYVSYAAFGDTESFAGIFYRFPTNRPVFFASAGYAASMTLIYSSFIAGTSTMLLLTSKSYLAVYRQGVPILLYLGTIFIAGYFCWDFYRKEYERYRSNGPTGTLRNRQLR